MIPPCPAWCVVDHAETAEDLTRVCAAASEQIPTLTHDTISATAIRIVDLVSGRVYPPEVRLRDTTLTAAAALRLAAQLLDAADLAEE